MHGRIDCLANEASDNFNASQAKVKTLFDVLSPRRHAGHRVRHAPRFPLRRARGDRRNPARALVPLNDDRRAA